MKSDKEFIIDKFYKVKAMGFVPSRRKHDTGIGKTFEDYVGVVENNLDAPDLAGFEIKSHREISQSYVTLFTKRPDFPRKANSYLNSHYGSPYDDNPQLNNLHTSMFATRFNSYKNKYSFRLTNDRSARLLKIGIYELADKRLLDDSIGYTYDTIESVLNKKIKNLFYVGADCNYRDGVERFHFNRAVIYTDPSLERFMNLVDQGLIMYDIRIGSYKSGKNYGKAHDHGSGFRILESNLHLLFSHKEEIK